MQTSAIPTTAAAGAGAQVNAGLTGIRSEDFMAILIKQLEFQDPFEPVTNEEMIAQMSTIRELELNTRLSDRLDQVTEQQRFASAASLIGKYAKGVVGDGEGNTFELEGIVTGVRFTPSGEAMLELDTGEVMPMTGLTQVSDADKLN